MPLEFQGRPSWAIKDPLTLGYFELRDEEFFVLNHLDGQTTADQLCQSFHEQFRPRTLSTAELQGFVGQLVSQGLLAATGPGYGHLLAARERVVQSRRRWSQFANVLAIRFRGIDPDRFLDWLLAKMGWMFSPWAIGLSLILMASALTLVIVQFETLVHRLPDARAMLTPSNLVRLAVLLGAVKVLHELGHGLTCKRFGGECRELGVMLLVFMPTLYCNVSDVWMVQDKWKRIAVSSAGMWVEAVIAATCTLLWWYSTPGLFHSMCLNVMFICGVSTFVFNGNPLMRYDGYFVLADWLEIPNLQQQSMAAVRTRLAQWYCFPDNPGTAKRFRTVNGCSFPTESRRQPIALPLTFLILWSLYRWLRPYGLGLMVQALAVPTITLMVLTPIMSAARFLRAPDTRDRIDWLRFGLRLGTTIIAVALLLSMPLPNRVVAGALLDQDAAQPVYVTFQGTLVEGAGIGDKVEAGQQVARLVHPEFEAERIHIEGEVRQHRVRLEQLERRRVAEPEAGLAIPTVREALQDFEQQLAQIQTSAERLVLKAPVPGIILPPPHQSQAAPAGTLPFWTGTPLDPRNSGCFLRAGTMVCLVGSPASRTALALINQDDVNLVKVGQVVRLHWNELAGEVMTGQIVGVSALDLDLLSHDVIARLNIPARATATGGLRPVGTWYQARVRLDETDAPLIRSSAGQAKILTEPLSTLDPIAPLATQDVPGLMLCHTIFSGWSSAFRLRFAG